MKNALPVRKNLRLNDYDYNTCGAYFLTFCTHNRRNTLSRIAISTTDPPEPILTAWGTIANTVIQGVSTHLPVTIDRYVIMPNHIHLIMLISEEDSLRAIHESPLHRRSIISRAVGYIKMNISKAIHGQYGNVPVWQRGFYDHVIRNQADYEMIAKYIHENPVRWELDKLYSND